MLKKRNTLLFLGSFFIPLVLLIVLWLILGLAPFGNHNLLVSDLGSQYMPFLSAFKQSIQDGNLSVYSFANGIGGSILSLAAYYVISPFNFLVLFFPSEQLPVAILCIITLKITCMGPAMFYYLKKTYQQTSFLTLLFSTSYSLCGFVTAYSLNFMWLDALILLPLLIYSIQRLWDDKKYVLYSVLLFITIITNYYMGYMICIFAVCYSIYWYFRKEKNSTGRSIKSFLHDGRLFFISSLLSGLSTSFILLPAIEGMLHTKKTNFDVTTFLPTPTFGPSFLSQFGVGTTNFSMRLDHLPTVFSGILMVLLFIAYFNLSEITKREKKAAALLVGFIFLSFWLEIIGTVWHMFQSPAGFPYRNTFIFSFLIIKFAYEAYLKIEDRALFSLRAPIIFSALLIVGQLFLVLFKPDFVLSNVFFVFSLLLIWLFYYLLKKGTHTTGAFKNGVIIFMTLLVCIELGTNYWISLKDTPFGNQEKFAATYQIQSDVVKKLHDQQKDLFRLKQTVDSKQAGYNEKNNGYNNPILYGYAGVSSYTSTLDASVQDSLSSLGLFAKNDRRISYVDNSKVTNLLLNVAYQVTPEIQNSQPEFSTEDTNVYKNDEAIGMGFLVPVGLKKITLQSHDPLKNQEAILQSIQKKSNNYFQDARKLTEVSPTPNNYQFSFQTTAAGDLYSYIPAVNWKNISRFEVNGRKVVPSVVIVTNQLFNLGSFEKGDTVNITIESKKKINLADWSLRTLNQQAFNPLVEAKRQKAISLKKQATGYSGDITVSDKDTLLYLSIPYDTNWNVEVDGKPVKTISVLDNFTGITLSEGSHHISMHYRLKSFDLGIMISIFVLFIVLFYYLLRWIFMMKRQ